MATKDLMAPTIGVLDVDGLHLPAGSLAPVTEAIQHVGDLYNGARRHGLTQLWLTDAWVRGAGVSSHTSCASPTLISRRSPLVLRRFSHPTCADPAEIATCAAPIPTATTIVVGGQHA